MKTDRKRVVFLTGATGGIGSAIARRLAAGGDVRLVLSGRDREKLEALAAELPAGTLLRVADVTDEPAIRQAMQSVRDELGAIDVLVNVPGMSIPAKLGQMELADFQRVFDVNVKGMFLASKHFVQGVDPAVGGLIVSISSIAAKSANPNAPAYCAAKAAMNMLSDGLSLQYKAANVRVTLLSPGAVSTPGFWGSRPVPHEQFLKPAEVAEVVAFVIGQPPNVLIQDVVFQPWQFYKSK
jgi:NADP-dependent 3-hydroxy acid dehydrogenase YdfG